MINLTHISIIFSCFSYHKIPKINFLLNFLQILLGAVNMIYKHNEE